MKFCLVGWILKLVLFSGVFNFFLHAQSYDIKTEKNILRSIEEALENGDNPTFTKKCDTLLNPHRINAFAYFLCGKHLLFVPEKDVQKAHAQAKKAYGRLKIAADDFAKTSKQTFYVLDAWQYMGLAALLMNDLDRAETYFMRTLERDNRIAAAWYNLGVVYERKGLETEAMRAFDRYLRLQSGESDVDF